MSAYGAIVGPLRSEDALLPSTLWLGPSSKEAKSGASLVSVHHLTLASTKSLIGLIDYLCSVFAQEVEDGMTYPQEGPIERQSFESYFFAGDVFVAISAPGGTLPDATAIDADNVHEIGVGIEEARNGRDWKECVAGFYYVKPNYPGRSSHICNGGFVVPPDSRGGGYGSILAKSYVHYAPRLGYQGSVFNLVYVTNTASVKLWERLGFTKAGLIPRAGRLKRRDGSGEEYVDAWVFYKSFVGDQKV